jgi:hypothetical protein
VLFGIGLAPRFLSSLCLSSAVQPSCSRTSSATADFSRRCSAVSPFIQQPHSAWSCRKKRVPVRSIFTAIIGPPQPRQASCARGLALYTVDHCSSVQLVASSGPVLVNAVNGIAFAV